MKTASAAMKAYMADLSENPKDWNGYVTDLYTITLSSGTVLLWTSGDVSVRLTQGPISSTSLFSGGSGYAVGDTGRISGVTFDATYTVTGVSSGAVTSYSISNNGTKYQVWNEVETFPAGTQPGNGRGFKINITAVTGSLTFSPLSPSDPNKPTINRALIRTKVGFSVDDLVMKINASPLCLVGGIPLLSTLDKGVFDGAYVFCQRLIGTTPWDLSLGTITVFAGTIGAIRNVTSVSAEISVNSLLKILSNQMPRGLYAPSCINTLFDAGCTLNRASFVQTGSVQSGSTTIKINTALTEPGGILPPTSAPTLSDTSVPGVNLLATTYYVTVTYVSALGETVASLESNRAVAANRLLTVASPPSATGATGYNVYVGTIPGGGQRQNGAPISIGTGFTESVNGLVQGSPAPLVAMNGYFSEGDITFTSGVNNGLTRTIAGYDASGAIQLVNALPHTPGVGDTFSVVPGCDLLMSTCNQKFNNLINYRGVPFVPAAETAL